MFLNDLLPLPYTEDTLARICDHVDQVQAALGRQMLLENPATYLLFAESTIEETEFLRAIARRTGCGLLLDVNNVFVAATNHNMDPADLSGPVPDGIRQGNSSQWPSETLDDFGATLLIDSHDTPVKDPVWTLYERLIARIGAVASLVEWDNDVPEWPVLCRDAERAGAILSGCAQPRGVRRGHVDPHPDRIAGALRDTAAAVPVGLEAWNGPRPERRFGVYRNNVFWGLVESLRSRFPVTAKIVGDEFFTGMADVFIRAHPPRSPLLLAYGDDLPDFAEAFPPLAQLPYLADVIRLEIARSHAYHAADRVPLDPSALSGLAAERLPDLVFEPHPSALGRSLRSIPS